jgi:hypothetical protein
MVERAFTEELAEEGIVHHGIALPPRWPALRPCGCSAARMTLVVEMLTTAGAVCFTTPEKLPMGVSACRLSGAHENRDLVVPIEHGRGD